MASALHSVENPSFLTIDSFSRALDAVIEGPTDEACADALTMAAEMVQEAVLSDQPGQDLADVFNHCAIQYGTTQATVLDRSADFHRLDDGGTLGLWLLPVSLNSPSNLPDRIALEIRSTAAVRMSAALLAQMGLAADLSKPISADTPQGWNYLLPSLYSLESMAAADLGDLVKLPREALAVVHGARRHITFKASDEKKYITSGAGQVYVLPFVTYHPPGSSISLPEASEKTIERMTRWIRASLEDQGDASTLGVKVLSQPQPYSTALTIANRLHREEFMRATLTQLLERAGVQANALAALVASYNIVKGLSTSGDPVSDGEGMLTLGVSLVSRLTGDVVGVANLSVQSHDGAEEVALTTYLLNQMGMTCTEQRKEPITSIMCQHCGSVQMAYPTLQAAQRGVSAPAQSIQ
jgi:hypothetical protein